MRAPESSLCSDDLDFNPVWFCEPWSKVIKKTTTQERVININKGQKQHLLKGNVPSLLKNSAYGSAMATLALKKTNKSKNKLVGPSKGFQHKTKHKQNHKHNSPSD